jgi:hypothetical protein
MIRKSGHLLSEQIMRHYRIYRIYAPSIRYFP